MADKPYKEIQVTPEERETFVVHHSMQANHAEAYIWMAFSNADERVSLWTEELLLAADMAARAGLPDLAERLKN